MKKGNLFLTGIPTRLCLTAMLVFGFTVIGCDGTTSLLPDTTPPANVTILTGTPGDAQVTLTWTDPADEDLASIEISFTPTAAGVTQPLSVDKGTGTKTITGLTNDTPYTFTVKAVDTSANKSPGETTAAITPVASNPSDTTPPANVTALTGTPGDAQVTLTWTDPADEDLTTIEITFTPEAVGVTQPLSVAKGAGTKTITGLANGTAYTFTVKAVDTSDNKSAGETTAAITPVAAPTGSLSITVGFNYGNIAITGNEGENVISQTGAAPTTLNLSASGYTNVVWYVDGQTPGTEDDGSGITINAADHPVDLHRVTFTGKRDGVLYSQIIPFWVIQ